MPLITKKLLEHLASLSRLELSADESKRFLKDLGAILKHVDDLKAVSTEGVQPMTGASAIKNILRDDREGAGNPDALIALFPESDGRHLKVPKIL